MSNRLPYNQIGFSEAEARRSYAEVEATHDYNFMALTGELLEARGSCTLADIGCGNSSFGLEIARTYPAAQVYTVDEYSDEERGHVRTADPANLHFRQGSADDLPFPDDFFDIIVTTWGPSAWGTMDPSGERTYITEIGRTLKPDGLAFSRPEGKVFAFPLDTIINHPQFAIRIKDRAKAIGFKALKEDGFKLSFHEDPNCVRIYGPTYLQTARQVS